MTIFVPRKAASIQSGHNKVELWLEDWRGEAAYVLLGDPGSGKSTCLKREAEATGGRYIQAALIQEDLAPPISPNEVLFIDAVDEVRGTSGSGTDVLGAIGRFIRTNGCRSFRIACREADWRGEGDKQLISAVAPEGVIKVLHLTPLSAEDIRRISASFPDTIKDVGLFIDDAHKHGVFELLGNPLLLELMIEAVGETGQWPSTRTQVYESACRRLAEEKSEAHRRQSALQPGVIETILADAGNLCAILLLSGSTAITRSGQLSNSSVNLNSLPKELNFINAEKAIRSKVFTIEGDLIHVRHRTIAEYLGARALSKLVKNGLPLARVLSLMQSLDGTPVEAMRGLYAWLTVHLQGPDRLRMLNLDPLGFITNGDAATLTRFERIEVLEALSASAKRNRWFRSGVWVEHPFGPLATPDMEEIYLQKLNDPTRSEDHLIFIDCLLDALKHAPAQMSALSGVLAFWFQDKRAFDGLRASAYEAWHKHTPEKEKENQILFWLDGIDKKLIKDEEGRLLERVLRDAYPGVIQTEVLKFLRPDTQSAEFSVFWTYYFNAQTPENLILPLCEQWLALFPDGLPHDWIMNIAETSYALLLKALLDHGDTASAEDLYRWLAIGLGEFGNSPFTKANKPVVDWLRQRPQTMKKILKAGYDSQENLPKENKKFWHVDSRLHGTPLPPEWVFWKMELANHSNDLDFVQWLVNQVANTALSQPQGFDLPTHDEIYQWVRSLVQRYPEAETWLEAAWTTPIEEWRVKSHRSRVEFESARERNENERRRQIEPLIAALPDTPLPIPLLNQISIAYQVGFTDVRGETPEERVTNFLCLDSDATRKALLEIDQTLLREDLPETSDIIEIEYAKKEHFLKRPALIAAARNSENWKTWSLETQQKLVDFWLTYGAGDEPLWFKNFCSASPNVVAPVLTSYINRKLNKKDQQFITGLWHLTNDETRVNLGRIVIEELLRTFPISATNWSLDKLNDSVLPGMRLLPVEDSIAIANRKLSVRSMSISQKIAWLVALLPYQEDAIERLSKIVGQNRNRVHTLGKFLYAQRIFGANNTVSPLKTQCLITLLAPFTPHEPNWPGGSVTQVREREELVHAMLRGLGSNPHVEAGKALRELSQIKGLGKWLEVIEFQVQAHHRLFLEASFKPANYDEVSKVLCNGPPASISDLLFVLIDHIRGIEAELRGDPAFQLRNFWKDNRTTPRGEEECRDELRALLLHRLE